MLHIFPCMQRVKELSAKMTMGCNKHALVHEEIFTSALTFYTYLWAVMPLLATPTFATLPKFSKTLLFM